MFRGLGCTFWLLNIYLAKLLNFPYTFAEDFTKNLLLINKNTNGGFIFLNESSNK